MTFVIPWYCTCIIRKIIITFNCFKLSTIIWDDVSLDMFNATCVYPNLHVYLYCSQQLHSWLKYQQILHYRSNVEVFASVKKNNKITNVAFIHNWLLFRNLSAVLKILSPILKSFFLTKWWKIKQTGLYTWKESH